MLKSFTLSIRGEVTGEAIGRGGLPPPLKFWKIFSNSFFSLICTKYAERICPGICKRYFPILLEFVTHVRPPPPGKKLTSSLLAHWN